MERRISGPGLYGQFYGLRKTSKGNSLSAQPDVEPLALAIMRRARNLGVGPMETLRRHLDEESRRVERRLAELEKS
jgi:hypothetical protein